MLHRLTSKPYAAATTPEVMERFVTSWLLPPSVLFFWRAFVSLYAFIVLFTILGYDYNHGQGVAADQSFSYFTVLGYWGLAFYYGVAAAHTCCYWLKGEAWLQRWPSGLQWAHSVFYSSITTFPFIVTMVVFWSLLAYGALSTQFNTWVNISEHGLNSFLAFAEIVLTRANPSPWINLVMVIVLIALYLALAELVHAAAGYYVYDFLDPEWLGKGVVAGACIAILVVTILIFVLMRYIAVLRKWLTEDVGNMHGKFSERSKHHDGAYGDVESQGHVTMEVMTKGTSPELSRRSSDVPFRV